jgi:CYTH domain-containing protein
MATEIERKFLVDAGIWQPVTEGVPYRQGYLSRDKERVVRVRIAGDQAYLNVKGASDNISRLELEYPIPVADAEVLLDRLCLRPLIEKTRYRQRVGAHVWEIDVFHGDNAGLIVAEIELSHEAESFDLPPWIREEVSADPRYFNANLSLNPFRTWSDRE